MLYLDAIPKLVLASVCTVYHLSFFTTVTCVTKDFFWVGFLFETIRQSRMSINHVRLQYLVEDEYTPCTKTTKVIRETKQKILRITRQSSQYPCTKCPKKEAQSAPMKLSFPSYSFIKIPPIETNNIVITQTVPMRTLR